MRMDRVKLRLPPGGIVPPLTTLVAWAVVPLLRRYQVSSVAMPSAAPAPAGRLKSASTSPSMRMNAGLQASGLLTVIVRVATSMSCGTGTGSSATSRICWSCWKAIWPRGSLRRAPLLSQKTPPALASTSHAYGQAATTAASGEVTLPSPVRPHPVSGGAALTSYGSAGVPVPVTVTPVPASTTVLSAEITPVAES